VFSSLGHEWSVSHDGGLGRDSMTFFALGVLTFKPISLPLSFLWVAISGLAMFVCVLPLPLRIATSGSKAEEL
jgi:hypothetical protein